MADINSIFYKIGQATKSNVGNAIDALKAADNTWTGTNDFNKAVSVGTDGTAANLTVKGDVSSVKVTASGAVSGSSVSATGAVSGGSASITNAVSAGSVSATGEVSGGSLSTTGNATIGGGATITGDLIVNGTTTTLSTTELEVKDNIVHISKGASAGSYDKDSGFYFERGSGNNAAAFVYDESAGSFVVGTLAGSGTPTESLGTGVVSATFTTNASNQVTAIVYTGPSGPLTYVAEGSSYSNTSVGLGGKKFTARYQEGTNYIDAVFSNGELVRLNHHGATLVAYDFSNVIAPSGSTDDIANATPTGLTVGSLKIESTSLGDLADFNAGLSA